MDNFSIVDRCKVEEGEDWINWSPKIPPLKFNSKWKVKIIPPFNGALVRFQIEYKEAWVSVYLDVFERLGFFGGKPYWEVYPVSYDDYDDVVRFELDNTKGLLKCIKSSIDTQNKNF